MAIENVQRAGARYLLSNPYSLCNVPFTKYSSVYL